MTFRALIAFAILIALACTPAPVLAQGAASPLSGCGKTSRITSGPNQQIPVPGKPGVTRNILPGSPGKPVEIECDDMQFFADRIEWVSDDPWLVATGNVVLKQAGLNLYADHARFNRDTKLGTFYDATGNATMAQERADKSMFGGQEPDVRFVAASIEKTGPKSYRLVKGFFTSCAQPTPRWLMAASTGSFTLDKHVILKNTVLKVKDVPVFYLPAIYVPLNHEGRSTGVLLPSFGSSTLGGFTLNNAFFWAINRSQDATFYHQLFKKTGQGYGADYRFVSAPGSTGKADFHVIDEHAVVASDNTAAQPARRSYTLNADVSQALSRSFRLIGQVNYFSDATTQQLYQQNVYDFSQRSRRASVELSGGIGRYRLRTSYEQNDTYNGTDFVSTSRRGYGPRAIVSVAGKTIGRSKVYVSASSEVAYVIRQDEVSDPLTNHSLWRVDASPTISAPLSSLSFLTATTRASWRFTEWSESRDPLTGNNLHVPISRQLLTLEANATGPKFGRVFSPASGRSFRHLIEPSLTFQWTSPYTRFDNLVQLDGAETQVGGTTSVTYGISTSVMMKPKPAPGASAAGVSARTILQGSVQQTYYTNALAASYDPQYQAVTGLAPPSPFSPISMRVDVTPVAAVTAQFRTDIDSTFKTPRTVSASANVNSRYAQVNVGWSKQRFISGLAGFDNPLFAPHFLNASATMRTGGGHVGGTYAFNIDIEHKVWLQQRVVAFYNTQCCGITVDYQTTDLSHLGVANLTSNHTINFSFSLAGLGSFANPLGSFGR